MRGEGVIGWLENKRESWRERERREEGSDDLDS